MEPFANGFMILVAGAAVLGVLVGAIGGAVAWRVRGGLFLGGLLTACAFLVALIADHPEDATWLRAKLIWGVPSMSVAFLIASASAVWLERRTRLRPTWIALLALVASLGLGFLYLMLFRISMGAPLVGALVADTGLVLVLILLRNRATRGTEAC